MVYFSDKGVAESDSTNNVNFTDVVGNKLDKSFSDNNLNPSIVGYLRAGFYHVHSAALVVPNLANAKTIATGAGAWELGAAVEIIPTTEINKLFDIHHVNIHRISANDEYQIILYKDVAGVLTQIGTTPFSRTAAQSQENNLPIQVQPIEANSKIVAKIASKSGGAKEADIKLYYHTYPDVD